MKITRLLLMLILTISVITSCAVSDNSVNDDTELIGDDSTAESEPVPELPDYDMEGKEIRIFTQAWYDFRPLDVVDIGVEELTGDDFNDAAYNRNQRIQQNYNCEIVEISFKEHMNSFTKLCNTVYAADDAYDFCILESANLLESITSKILLDLKEVPYIDVEKPWWNSESYEAFSICGTNYAVCSDITTTDDLSVWNIYFNKDMIVDYNLDDPYELVRSGDWTYEKLFPMAKTVSDDLDGNNIRNEKDQYGISHIVDTASAMINGVGINIAEKDSEGRLYFTINNDNAITKIISMFERLYDTEVCFNCHIRGGNEMTIFTDGNVLFSFGGIYYARSMRLMEQEFGMLPYPKYDSSQEQYYSSTSPQFLSMVTVPITNTALTETGIFMEAYAYEGYKTIRPAFYDVLLQGKIARDDQSLEMLDFIFDNITYDVGNIFNFDMYSFDLMNLTIKYNLDVASFIASREPSAQTALDALMNELSK